jgi:hypothetical protein
MTRLDPGRREVTPSRPKTRRRGPSFGPALGVSVPISVGLPLIVVGLALLLAGLSTNKLIYWILGGGILAAGLSLFASGRRL